MKINSFSQTGIYPDLIKEFAEHGHNIYVVSPCENSNKKEYELLKEQNNVHLIQALIPDYFGVGFVKKGISSMLIEKRYAAAINKAIPDVKIDLILYSTPPITFSGVIEKIKKRYKAYTYLLLKDIWPQGPIDIGVLSESGYKGIITRYFKKKEKKLYALSDYIGCMSNANCEYLVNISGISSSKVELCPNSIKVRDGVIVDKRKIRIENGVPVEKTIFVYGGNLGVAQGIDFIIDCLILNEKNDSTFILIVGSGTEYKKLDNWFKLNNPKNSKLVPYLPQTEYKKLMASCDVGLIFLDYRFTIPNFPSRILSYMEAKMPVLAATDTSSDIGFVIEKGGFGFWCESNNPKSFMDALEKFDDSDVRTRLGEKSYDYLVSNYSVEITYKTIISHICKDSENVKTAIS